MRIVLHLDLTKDNVRFFFPASGNSLVGLGVWLIDPVNVIIQDGFWIGVRRNESVYAANAIPGFLNCSRLGTLPGCLFTFDAPNKQCADGRTGTYTSLQLSPLNDYFLVFHVFRPAMWRL